MKKKMRKKKWLNDFVRRLHKFNIVIKHCKPVVPINFSKLNNSTDNNDEK